MSFMAGTRLDPREIVALVGLTTGTRSVISGRTRTWMIRHDATY